MTHIIDFLNGEHRLVEKLLLALRRSLRFSIQEGHVTRFYRRGAVFRRLCWFGHEATKRILFDVLRECDAEAAAMLDGLESEHRDDITPATVTLGLDEYPG